MTTKTRKKTKSTEEIEPSQVAHDYAKGVMSVSEIAEKYSTTENNVGIIVSRFWKELTNMKESRALIAHKPNRTLSLKAIQNTDQINADFLSLLSEPTDPLTEPESIYAWIYVHTGDTVIALEESQLTVGLLKGDRKSRHSYDKALLIRGLYLNSKANVYEYIKDLRERKYIDQDITKASVQLELKEQLDQLKKHPHQNRKEILRVIELLGKTVGAFIERHEVGTIDHNKAFDQMLKAMDQAEAASHNIEGDFKVLSSEDIES